MENSLNNICISILFNGLCVVICDMFGLYLVVIGIWVNVGCCDECVDQNGIVYFLEYMVFKGMFMCIFLQIVEVIENVGGYINVYILCDVISYYVCVLLGDVGMVLDVILDIVLNLIFDVCEIEVECGVILQEIGQLLDMFDDVIFDWL